MPWTSTGGHRAAMWGATWEVPADSVGRHALGATLAWEQHQPESGSSSQGIGRDWMSGPLSFWYTFCVFPSIQSISLASESTAATASSSLTPTGSLASQIRGAGSYGPSRRHAHP